MIDDVNLETKTLEYKVSSHNSTVCGYPGRDFDWSKFDWEGKTIHKPKYFRAEGAKDRQAPEPYVDDGLIAPNCQYLHIPYEWEKLGTIYRVRPNESMYAGEIYRGYLVLKQEAIKKDDGHWYWVLTVRKPIEQGD